MLQRLQNMACRAILKVNRYAHVIDIHESLELTSLYQRRCHHICNTMHNLLTGIGPPDCIELFKYVHETHQVATRSAVGDLLSVLKTQLKTCERDFIVQGPHLWNQIPLTIRKLQSHDKFKDEVKSVTFY